MRFGGIVLATALILGACSSDPAPKEPDAPAPTTSSTPTIAVPTMPPQASEDSPEGAAAFVKHYVDVFNYAAATGDVEELTKIATKCASCNAYAEDFKHMDAEQRPTSRDAWTLSNISVASDEESVQVAGDIEALNDSASPYKLTFILPPGPPHTVLDVVDRGR